MLARLSALVAILACLGCVPKPAPSSVVVCLPPVTTFTRQQQADMSAALKQLPPGSPLGEMAVDWERMRVQARACNDGR